MLEHFFSGILRKRRHVDDHHCDSQSEAPSRPAKISGGGGAGGTGSMWWSSLFPFRGNSAPATCASNSFCSSVSASAGASGATQQNQPPSFARIPQHDNAYDEQIDRPINLNERFVTVLDQLDARVEKFRKDALGLQEKRDFLLMSIDLIKSHDMLHSMMDCERDEISCYIQRVNSRLSTVELNVRTVRDHSQEDSLSQINELIDMMITMNDPVMARQRCQQYLNACCSAAEAGGGLEAGACISSLPVMSEGGIDIDAGPVDKKFEGTLLGCTLDDQKNIKKRLQALMGYLNKQIIQN